MGDVERITTTMLALQLQSAEERAATWERIASSYEAQVERLEKELADCHTECLEGLI